MRIFKPDAETVPCIFDPSYGCYRGTHSHEAIPLIFGKRGSRQVRKWIKSILNPFLKSPPPFVCRAPRDAVVFFRPHKKGLILVSKDSDLVVKIFFQEEFSRLLKNETETLEYLKTTGFSKFLPIVRGSGEMEGGGFWQATHFYSNDLSLSSLRNKNAFLLRDIKDFVLSPMTEYYRAYPLRKVSFSQRLTELEKELSKAPFYPQVLPILETLKEEARSLDFEVCIGQIHFDLHAGNMLWNGRDLRIIDFEGSTGGLIFLDAFDFYRRYMEGSSLESFRFWRSVKRGSPLPPHFKEFLTRVNRWLGTELGCGPIPEEGAMMMLKLYALERLWLLFKLKSMDRFSDINGFERRLLLTSTHGK